MSEIHVEFTAGMREAFNFQFQFQFSGNRPDLYQKCNRGSHSSDTSSAYSGSDTMTSVHSSSLDADEVDLSGLVESVVDSDEEDLAESMDVSVLEIVDIIDHRAKRHRCFFSLFRAWLSEIQYVNVWKRIHPIVRKTTLKHC